MPVPRLRDRRYEGFMANSTSAQAETGTRRLDSWKEIANYLDRDVTTVMRWERERALPVHRVPGHAKRQTVYAYPKEIDEWLLGKGNGGSGLRVGETKTEVRSQELEVRSHDRSESDHRTPEIGESEVRSSGQATGGSEKGIRDSGLGIREAKRNTSTEQIPPATERSGERAEKDALSPWMEALVPHGRRQFFTYLLTAGCVAVAAVMVFSLTRPRALPKILAHRRITNDGRLKETPIVTDGARIYFPELTPSGWVIAEVPAGGGEVESISTFFNHPSIQDISRNRSEILILDPVGVVPTPRLWAMPLSGGSPRRIGNVFADAAAWSPDGNSIAYAAGHEIILCGLDGGEPRKLASLPGSIMNIHWSPDGSVLRFALVHPEKDTDEMWEVRADGSAAHPLLPGWRATHIQADGRWTQDGKYFLFSSSGTSGSNLWALSGKGGILGRAFSPPTKLTSGPLSVISWVPSPSGNRSFSLEQGYRARLLRFARGQNQLVPYLPGISANYLDFNWNGEWVVYVDPPDLTLWKSRPDGTQAARLTPPLMKVELPRWSPDGKWIAFMGIKRGDENWKVYLIPAEGGECRIVMASNSPQGAPTWSPDSKQVAFGDLRDASGEFPSSAAIHVVDLTSHVTTTLPGSNGLWTARWAPDGRYMAALTTDAKTLKVFDFHTVHWQEVASAGSISDLNWSHKGDAVYFMDVLTPSSPTVYRVRLQSGKMEKVTTLTGSDPIRSTWLGLTPDDSILVSNSAGTTEIYALDLDLP